MLKIPATFALLGLACVLATAQSSTDAPPRQLSLRRAVEIALSPDGNAEVQLAKESQVVAREQKNEARAALLPTVNGSLREQRQVANVAAMGIQVQVEGIPVVLGSEPFSTFDARVSAEQTLFDWSAVRRTQAAQAAVRASGAVLQDTQQATAARVAALYFAALRAEARVQAALSDVDLAEALGKLAADRAETGRGLAIEVTRAGAQTAHARQRLLTAQNDSFRAKLQLCHELGLPPGEPIVLTDQLALNSVDLPSVAEALESALRTRSDLRTQQERGHQADLLHGEARAASLPSIYGYADYGPLGLTPANAIETYTVGLGLKIPVFDGGRREARRAETLSLARQERIREKDLHGQIEIEVREALEGLQIAAAQAAAAEQGVALAGEEVSQARRRNEQGLATSLDIIAAQNRLELAQDERIAALYAHNLARLELARAQGDVMRIVR